MEDKRWIILKTAYDTSVAHSDNRSVKISFNDLGINKSELLNLLKQMENRSLIYREQGQCSACVLITKTGVSVYKKYKDNPQLFSQNY